MYIDVSGTTDDPVICAGACYASDAQWREFERVWLAILRDAEAQHFHATDFYNCRREFDGWERNSERQKSFCERFARATGTYVKYNYAFAVDVEKFDRQLGRPLASAQKTPHDRMRPDTYCTALALGRIEALALRPNSSSAEVFLEEGPGVGEALDYLKFLKRSDPGYARYASFDKRPKSEFPLQAADFWAHEAWHFQKDRLAGVDRPMRKPLEIMMAAAKGRGHVEAQLASEEEYRKSREFNDQFAQSNPLFARPPEASKQFRRS